MSDDKRKRRLYDVKEDFKNYYREWGYRIINSDNEIVCFIAKDNAGTHDTWVRVAIDNISDYDKKMIEKLRIMPNQRKEIICRPHSAKKPIRLIYDYLNNLCQ